jgi:hypothetical protein
MDPCRCLAGRTHLAPDEECTCGLCAVKREAANWTFGLTNKSDGRLGVVAGTIELAGKVIGHHDGYRAERARIRDLIALEGSEPMAHALAARVGAPGAAPRRRPADGLGARCEMGGTARDATRSADDPSRVVKRVKEWVPRERRRRRLANVRTSSLKRRSRIRCGPPMGRRSTSASGRSI